MASRYYEQVDGKSVCIDGEIPFDIPSSWAWTRLGMIGSWGAGATPSRGNPVYYKNGTIPWLKTGDLNDGVIVNIPEFITKEALQKTSLQLNPIGSVLIAMYGATIGKLGILAIEATTNQACCACKSFTGIQNNFLFWYLFSQRKQFKALGDGGAQPNISKDKIVDYLIPLPPKDEQNRISDKITSVFQFIQDSQA